MLMVGLGFGLSGVRPVPAIILAQALNGFLLPLVSVFLFLAVNDRRLMGEAVNGRLANVATLGVVWVAMLLGVTAVSRAVSSAFDLPPLGGFWLVVVSSFVMLLLVVPAYRSRRGQ